MKISGKFQQLAMWVIIGFMASYMIYGHFSNRTKTGYINIQDVYSHFELKKDLQKKYEASKDARKKILDSLALDIRMLGQQIDAEKGRDTMKIRMFKEKRMEFYERKSSIDQADSAQLKQYDSDILAQLNQYVKEYGDQHHYQYIFGNGGSGFLMQADKSLDITNQVTKYVNEKYEGKK